MKTDLPILWVDDNQAWVDPIKDRLATWLDGHGFSLVVDYSKTGQGVVDCLTKKDIDFILIDYRLRGSKTGDEVIKDIREANFYQDIVFYSQDGNPANSYNATADGVFFVERQDAFGRVKDLIQLRIKRLSDLATLRGWIVADAIELEVLLGKLLAKCFGTMETLFTERVLQEEGLLDFGKKHKMLNGILKDRIAELNENTPKSPALSVLQGCKKILDVFPSEIIEVRNALAHQAAELSLDGKKSVRTRTKAAKSIVISQDECVRIRKDIRRHYQNLASLAGSL